MTGVSQLIDEMRDDFGIYLRVTAYNDHYYLWKHNRNTGFWMFLKHTIYLSGMALYLKELYIVKAEKQTLARIDRMEAICK